MFYLFLFALGKSLEQGFDYNVPNIQNIQNKIFYMGYQQYQLFKGQQINIQFKTQNLLNQQLKYIDIISDYEHKILKRQEQLNIFKVQNDFAKNPNNWKQVSNDQCQFYHSSIQYNFELLLESDDPQQVIYWQDNDSFFLLENNKIGYYLIKEQKNVQLLYRFQNYQNKQILKFIFDPSQKSLFVIIQKQVYKMDSQFKNIQKLFEFNDTAFHYFNYNQNKSITLCTQQHIFVYDLQKKIFLVDIQSKQRWVLYKDQIKIQTPLQQLEVSQVIQNHGALFLLTFFQGQPYIIETYNKNINRIYNGIGNSKLEFYNDLLLITGDGQIHIYKHSINRNLIKNPKSIKFIGKQGLTQIQMMKKKSNSTVGKFLALSIFKQLAIYGIQYLTLTRLPPYLYCISKQMQDSSFLLEMNMSYCKNMKDFQKHDFLKSYCTSYYFFNVNIYAFQQQHNTLVLLLIFWICFGLVCFMYNWRRKKLNQIEKIQRMMLLMSKIKVKQKKTSSQQIIVQKDLQNLEQQQKKKDSVVEQKQ